MQYYGEVVNSVVREKHSTSAESIQSRCTAVIVIHKCSKQCIAGVIYGIDAGSIQRSYIGVTIIGADRRFEQHNKATKLVSSAKMSLRAPPICI